MFSLFKKSFSPYKRSHCHTYMHKRLYGLAVTLLRLRCGLGIRPALGHDGRLTDAILARLGLGLPTEDVGPLAREFGH